MQNKDYQWIDKTECLQEGIERFPSIYIEGNAATGKTVAVQMLLAKYPNTKVYRFDVAREEKKEKNLFLLGQKLREIQAQMQSTECWAILENMPEMISENLATQLADMVETIRNDSKIIFVSRYKPQAMFLQLLWKAQMELIPMSRLMLSKEEVRNMAEHLQYAGDADKIYEKTGGWAGCVTLLLRLSKNKSETIEELLKCYEVKTYICQEILSVLTGNEKEILGHAAGCPWISAELCQQAWNFPNAEKVLQDLERRGFLVWEKKKGRYFIHALFLEYIEPRIPVQGCENVWYEKQECIEEALFCLKKSGAEKEYENCVVKHYDKIAELGLLSEEMMEWTQKKPQYCYLRGAYAWRIREFETLKKEISYVEKITQKNHLEKEILLNLAYLNPEMTLSKWLKLLEEYAQDGIKYRLYELQGNSITCLCGIRDLTELFACTKKEEQKNCSLWKKSLGEAEWNCYRMARIDYYKETRRKDQIPEEDRKLLRDDTVPLEEDQSHVSRWLHDYRMDDFLDIEESNYAILYCRAKAYILLGQYDRAERILRRLVPYLQTYHRTRFVAETLFMQSVINWKKNLKGQAVRTVIESFAFSGNGRYVDFYTEYGLPGRQVLEEYMEWLKVNSTGDWKRKKKYQYGSVLRMPYEDYVQVIVRSAKKSAKQNARVTEEYVEERLTLMETIVLQNIARGMTNAQICEELDLKLPTVKGHVYSIFKKLGVSSRVQAIMRGKELGVIK